MKLGGSFLLHKTRPHSARIFGVNFKSNKFLLQRTFCVAMNLIEKAKKEAAYRAVDTYIKDGMKVGIGSGSTVVYVVERLIQRVKNEKLNVICVPTSFQSNLLIVNGGLSLSSLSIDPSLDVTIDGADEVDSNLHLIKGGGGCQTQEKIVAACAKKLVIVADYRKDSTVLGEKWKKGIPLEVIPMAYVPIMNKIEEMKGKGVLRMAANKAGPVVSDNGNFIIDADFGLIHDPKTLNDALLHIPGVVETGLFIGMAEKVYFGMEDGTVQERPSMSPKM